MEGINHSADSANSAQLPGNSLAGFWCLLVSERRGAETRCGGLVCLTSTVLYAQLNCGSHVPCAAQKMEQLSSAASGCIKPAWFKSCQDFSHRLIYSIGSLFPADSPSSAPDFPVSLRRKVFVAVEALMLRFMMSWWDFKMDIMWRHFGGSSFC